MHALHLAHQVGMVAFPSALASLVSVFKGVVLLSIADESDASDDPVAILRMLRQILPDAPELAVAQARQHLCADDLDGARQVLEDADARAPHHAVLKAMLALTLRAQGDSGWRAYVHELGALAPDELATSIVLSMQRDAPV